MDIKINKKQHSLKKLVAIGSVSLACVFFAIATITSYQIQGTKFLDSSDPEIQHAFIQFIAKYGRSYGSKEELPLRYELFSKTYKMVKTHNALENTSFKMELNKFADRASSEMRNGLNVESVMEGVAYSNELLASIIQHK